MKPTSKTQDRALGLLGLGQAKTYSDAAARLEAAGFSRDGMPFGHTWQATSTLGDAELVNLLKSDRTFLEEQDERIPEGGYPHYRQRGRIR